MCRIRSCRVISETRSRLLSLSAVLSNNFPIHSIEEFVGSHHYLWDNVSLFVYWEFVLIVTNVLSSCARHVFPRSYFTLYSDTQYSDQFCGRETVTFAGVLWLWKGKCCNSSSTRPLCFWLVAVKITCFIIIIDEWEWKLSSHRSRNCGSPDILLLFVLLMTSSSKEARSCSEVSWKTVQYGTVQCKYPDSLSPGFRGQTPGTPVKMWLLLYILNTK